MVCHCPKNVIKEVTIPAVLIKPGLFLTQCKHPEIIYLANVRQGNGKGVLVRCVCVKRSQLISLGE